MVLPFPLALPFVVLLLCASLWAAYLVADRLVPAAPAHVRLCATAIVHLWFAHVTFNVLTALHAFRLLWASLVVLALTAAAHHLVRKEHALTLLCADIASFRQGLRAFVRSPVRAPVLAIGTGLVAFRALRAIVSPPLAWDALLYHCYKPALWVQTGTQLIEPAPDQWSYLAFFPDGAQVPWAWAMLAPRSDALVAPAALGFWGLCGAAAYGLARCFDSGRSQSALAALATAFLPALANQSASSYVDTQVLALFLLAIVFVTRLWRTPSPGDAVLALATFGLGAAVKLSGVPAFCIGSLVVVALVSRWQRPAPSRIALFAAGVTAALAVCAPGYLRTWLLTGSPTYPVALTLFGHTIFDGNVELAQLYSGDLLHVRPGHDDLAEFARAVVLPFAPPQHEHLGFGLGAPALLLLGAMGVAQLSRDRRRRLPVMLLLGLAALPALTVLFSPGFLAHRTYWKFSTARLIVQLPASAAITAASVRTRFARDTLTAIVALDLLALVPQGTSAPAMDALAALAPSMALIA
ncbi:MAG: hypothetical protein WCJ30_07910, partial [Deltaproteobacteria bacterium]